MKIRRLCVLIVIMGLSGFSALGQARERLNPRFLEIQRAMDLVRQDHTAEEETRERAERIHEAMQAIPLGAFEKSSGAAVPSAGLPRQDAGPQLIRDDPAPSGRDQNSLYRTSMDMTSNVNRIEVGTEVFDYSYREEGLMKVDGPMYGVFMNYRHRYHDNPPVRRWSDIAAAQRINLLMIDARLSGARDLKYRSGDTGYHYGEDHYALETRVAGGIELPWRDSGLMFVPYGGLGYRYLRDDNGGTQTSTGAWAYDRESHYFYVPIGLETRTSLTRTWTTRLTMEYDWFLGGRQYSHLEDVPGYSQTMANRQQQGYGLRGAWRLAYEGPQLGFFIEPFARYWHIDDSDVRCTSEECGLEPKNRTREYGARMGIIF